MGDFKQFIKERQALFDAPAIASRLALDQDRPAFNLFADKEAKRHVRAVKDRGEPDKIFPSSPDDTIYRNDLVMHHTWALIIAHYQDTLSVDLQNSAAKPDGNFIRAKSGIQVHDYQLKGSGKVSVEIPAGTSSIAIEDGVQAHLAFDGRPNYAFKVNGQPTSLQLTDRFLSETGSYSTHFHVSVQDGRLKIFNTQIVATGEVKREHSPLIDVDAGKLQHLYIGSNPAIKLDKDTLAKSKEITFKPEDILGAPKYEAQRLEGELVANPAATRAQQVALQTKSGEITADIKGTAGSQFSKKREEPVITP